MVIMEKIPVGVLGATGSVGQKFIQLLADHPYLFVKEVAASERSVGKKYKDAVNWFLESPIPESIENLFVKPCDKDLQCKLVFSGLDASVAGEIETNLANAGYIVVSNSRNHRFDADVPLLIPEVNAEHVQILQHQKFGSGKIVTNPNCSTIGLTLALKPLLDAFGLEKINVTTMQAISGAGYPGISSLSIIENVIPFIPGEEEKLEREPLKILGELNKDRIKFLDVAISAQCNRVPVVDGHLLSVQVKLKKYAEAEDLIECWCNFKGEPQKLNLPMAPQKPIHYFPQPSYPQSRLHRNLENGMAISIGRLRKCNIFDYKFTVLSHNTVRGAAGGAILCAELLISKGYLD
jgi:aspartate-semialdehyde dehydrogenase